MLLENLVTDAGAHSVGVERSVRGVSHSRPIGPHLVLEVAARAESPGQLEIHAAAVGNIRIPAIP